MHDGKKNSYTCIDIQEYRLLMSSSPYRRVTVEIENGNLAMVLATDIHYLHEQSILIYLGVGISVNTW